MENNEKEIRRQKIIEEALRYESLGFSVMPLGSITKNENGKKIVEYPKDGWKKYQEHRATREEISQWDCENLGIVTGRISGFFSLDTDTYKKTFDQGLLMKLRVPVTPVQETASGGKQYLLKFPEGLTIKNDVCIGTKDSGIDIRGDGGMIIVPPSSTPYGEYSWNVSPFETPIEEASPELLEMVSEKLEGEKRIRKELSELVGLNEG
jgi:Bifunctional DNA primase/polymerase, N-terminal